MQSPPVQPESRSRPRWGLALSLPALFAVGLLIEVAVFSSRSGLLRSFGEHLALPLLLVLALLGAALGAAAIALLPRYSRLPAGLVAVVPAALPVLAVVIGWFQLSRGTAALAGKSGELEQRVHQFAEGVDAMLSLTEFSYGGSACLLVAFAFGFAWIARARVKQPKLGLPSLLSLIGAAGALVICIVAAVLWEPLRYAMVAALPIVLPTFIIIPLAATALPEADLESAERQAGGDVAAAGAALGAALVLTAPAAWAMLTHLVWGAVGGESIDPFQKYQVMARGWDEAVNGSWPVLVLMVVPLGGTLGALVARPSVLVKGMARILTEIVLVFVFVVPVALLVLIAASQVWDAVIQPWSVPQR